MASGMRPTEDQRQLQEERNKSLDLTVKRQDDFKVLLIRFNEIEGDFHSLQEIVPPHAQEWWQEQDPAWQDKMGEVRNQLNELCHDLEGLLSLRSTRVSEMLADLENELGVARKGLDFRTAAGRAKAS